MKKKLTIAAMGLAIAFTSFTFGGGSAFADSKMDQVIQDAKGTSYRSGGTTLEGFDCSGFTMYVFNKLGIKLPHQSGSQFKMGSSVSRDEMRPGDLVFFNTTGRGVSHVGIFVGEGKFAHSSTSRGVVVSSLNENYYANRFVGAKRIMSTDAYHSVASEIPDDDNVE
ncbi:C40 family peptidase [Paenibacillus sp. CMAA1739]|uniref:C40 family peptidase n=1 Tax=Paenibacillus ottowii TaxID=2315729 RepID=UPI0011B16103|nr:MULTISPECIES: C40 family peptidase [Paenibacillus]MDP1513283.1 C40 family peptidase [Paenibacillus ottowii]MEC4569239.1 C40 family peptidase [Paenibacillus sp. CMAA1739]QDY84998.1 NlpC/P60 family protein [Paenibacillus polymyxa]